MFKTIQVRDRIKELKSTKFMILLNIEQNYNSQQITDR